MKNILFASTFLLCACSDIKSSALNTSGMNAEIVAMAEGSFTQVEVVLKAGDANSTTYVELDVGDSLSATDGTETFELGHSSFGVFHSYNATFSATEEDTEFTISFEREIEDDAPSSFAYIAGDFDVTSPFEGDIHSRQNPLRISWETADDNDEEMNIKADGSCVYKIDETVRVSAGSYTINSSDFDSANSDAAQESCTFEIILERIRVGFLDPAFGSGSVLGGVRKRISIRLDP